MPEKNKPLELQPEHEPAEKPSNRNLYEELRSLQFFVRLLDSIEEGNRELLQAAMSILQDTQNRLIDLLSPNQLKDMLKAIGKDVGKNGGGNRLSSILTSDECINLRLKVTKQEFESMYHRINSNPELEDVRQCCRFITESTGMSQRNIAQAVGMTDGNFSNFLKGRGLLAVNSSKLVSFLKNLMQKIAEQEGWTIADDAEKPVSENQRENSSQVDVSTAKEC